MATVQWNNVPSVAKGLNFISHYLNLVFDFHFSINVVISNMVVLGLNLLRALCSEILIVFPFTWGGGVCFVNVLVRAFQTPFTLPQVTKTSIDWGIML